jgi:hypothetical protein
LREGITPEALHGFVQVRCLCGKVHVFLRDQVVEGLGVSRWKCGPCKRRFVVACTPGPNGQPDTFWPIFLEQVPPTGDTRQEGFSTDGAGGTEGPAELHFQCRCGCRLLGRSHLYGHPTQCPRCRVRLIVRVGYDTDQGSPVALLEYAEGGPAGGAGGGGSQGSRS